MAGSDGHDGALFGRGGEGGRVLGVGLVLERTSRGRWCEEKGREEEGEDVRYIGNVGYCKTRQYVKTLY